MFLQDRLCQEIKQGDREFKVDESGLIRYYRRICIPKDSELKQVVLEEAHRSNLSFHPKITKMYQDLKKSFWWYGIKRDVAEFVAKCLTCQKTKVEHQKPYGELQLLEIPKWK